MRRCLLLLAATMGCSHSGPAPTPPRAAAAPVVEATSLGMWMGKPPLAVHYLDVTLRNPSAESRWLVLSATFPAPGDPAPAAEGAESEIQVYLLAERPRVLLARGVEGHFWAVRLPGGGQVTVRRLAIQSWWEDTPPEVDLEARVAREIVVGGRPLAEVLGVDAASESGGDVKAPAGAADPRALSFWHPEAQDQSVAVHFDVESDARITVPLSRAAPPQ